MTTSAAVAAAQANRVQRRSTRPSSIGHRRSDSSIRIVDRPSTSIDAWTMDDRRWPIADPCLNQRPHVRRRNDRAKRRGVAHDLLNLGNDERAFAARLDVRRHSHLFGRAQLALDVVIQRFFVWMGHGLIVLLQQRAQLHARLEHLAFRGAFTDAEHLGDLFVLEPFDVVQHERNPAPIG